MNKGYLTRWRTNFFTGLAIVLPGVISVGVIFWLFFTISNITDTLLIFVPREMTHRSTPSGPGTGPMYWYWSVVALLVAFVMTSIVGLLTRYYLGKKIIRWVDITLLKVPLLNKVYGTIKQVNDAFTSGSKTSFQTVVMVEFPRKDQYSIGFLTGEQPAGMTSREGASLVCVFIPTTPNPTSGFLVLVTPEQVTKLDMSVADGIKFIVSLGSISPEGNLVPGRMSKLELPGKPG